jgi:Na+/H+ antiporter NhaC
MGIYSLIPPLIVVILAIKTKSSLIPLLAGCVIGYIMLAFMHVDEVTGAIHFGIEEVQNLDGENTSTKIKETLLTFPENFINGLYQVLMTNERSDGTYFNSLLWVLIVCALFGPFIQLIIASGGVFALRQKANRYLKTKKDSLLASYFLGIIFFVDDYLSALSVGATMRHITDQNKIPREYLGYIIGAVSVPLTVVVPISTWTVYVGGLMKEYGTYSEDTSALQIFLETIPYNIYAWVALLLGLFFALGWMPIFKKMKKANDRVEKTNETIAPDSESLSMEVKQEVKDENATIWAFILPMLVLVTATIYFDFDVYMGISLALTFLLLYYWIAKILPFSKIVELFETGFKSMTFVLTVLVITYLFKQCCDDLGLTDFVVAGVRSFPKEYLPVMLFLFIGPISIATGSAWGVYAIITPIVFALGQETGANTLLLMGALISAGIWGVNTCFYSDQRILIAASTESNMTAQAQSQLPYVMIAGGISALIFLILGFII